jgi:outer membrane protein OmpA-like peptidoglycan-associated protein
MKKIIICLTSALLLTLCGVWAKDTTGSLPDTTVSVKDTTGTVKDTTGNVKDTLAPVKDTTDWVKDTPAPVKDTTANGSTNKDTTAVAVIVPKEGDTKPLQDSAAAKDKDAGSQPSQPSQPQDSTAKEENAPRGVDTRWFISPLMKFQFQDFAMLEKNRKGYLSDANTLPFFSRGNASFAASAYKNITSRLAISADLGLSFGHATNDSVLISQTKSKTYNLLNAALYYHLLPASYRLQPYITVGINDIINDASYLSAPMGIGAKFNSKKIMVLGQITYGYAVNKNVSNTTMYSLGIYLPIKNKKQKQQEKDDQSPYNRRGKDDDKKKDSSANKNGGITINITINMDSVMRAKGLKNDDDGGSGRNGRNGRDGADGGDGSDGSDGGSGSGGNRRGSRHKEKLYTDLNLNDDFDEQDYKVDTINGQPVVRFVVYFEFNEYGLNSKAFSTIDKVISHLRHKPELSVEIKGYTDDVGTNQYNNFLSRRRAKMVLEYMNSRGVPTDYMKAKAYGSDDPVADNQDPNQAWLNRRAEIIVHEK